MSNLVYPTIHIGGSHGKTLFSQYVNAYHKVHEAIEAMHEIDCHARDYLYDETWGVAWQQHRGRFDALRRVESELMSVATHIMEKLPNE